MKNKNKISHSESSNSISSGFWGNEKCNSISGSSWENEEMRIKNEIEALSAIYIDAIEKVKEQSNGQYEILATLKPNHYNTPFFDPICWIRLKINYNRGYPTIPPGFEIVDKYNMTEKEIQEIYNAIDNIANIRADQNCEMINDIFDYLIKLLDDKSKSYSPFKRKEEPIEEVSSYYPSRKLSTGKYDQQKSQQKNHKRLNSYTKGNDLLGHNFTYNSSKLDDVNVDANFNNLNSQNIISTGKSRLLTDFHSLEKIGEGGGGSVYKVKNNFDGMFYAIKRVKSNAIIYYFIIKQINNFSSKCLFKI